MFFNLLRTIDLDRFEPFLAVTTPEGAYLEELGQRVPILQVGQHRYPVRGHTSAPCGPSDPMWCWPRCA